MTVNITISFLLLIGAAVFSDNSSNSTRETEQNSVQTERAGSFTLCPDGSCTKNT
ncbi:hypothetical protein J2X69_001321 [Algoriphagus sp. 4150]|nr:hypothetical protein [Algoriphagus sp. 4150]